MRRVAQSGPRTKDSPDGTGVGSGRPRPVRTRSTGRSDTGSSIALGHLSRWQIALLVAVLMGSKVLYLYPTMLSQKAGSSAWLAVIIETLLGLLGAWGWILWVNRTGAMGFVSSLRATCGRLLGDALALFFIVVFAAVTALNVRMFVGGAVIGLVPAFPLDAVLLLSILSSAYAAYLGLETVARAAVFFLAPTALSLSVVLAGMSSSFHLSSLLPFWGLGFRNTLIQGIVTAGAFGGLPAVAILKSYARNGEDLAWSAIAGTLIASVFILTGVVALTGIFPYPMSTRNLEPLGIMARAVFLGRFLQRLEAVFTFTWYFANAVQASFSYLLVLILLSQLCDTKTYRPFIPAVFVLTFGIAGIPANTLRAAQIMDRFFITRAGNLALALGWILAAVSRLRGRPTSGQEKPRPNG